MAKHARISPAHRNLLITLRTVQDQQARKRILKDVFGEIKRVLGIPDKHKLKVELDNVNSPDYLVLIRKKNGQKYPIGTCGRWVDAPPIAAPRNVVQVPMDKIVALLKDARNNGDNFADSSVDLADGVNYQLQGTNLIVDLT